MNVVPETPAPHPLRIPAFRAYWVARLSLTLGITSLVLIIGWQVYNFARETMSVKESAFMLGLVGLAQFLPLFVLTPITGWVADRFDRRSIARLTIGLQLSVAALLAAVTYAGALSLPILFFCAALMGVARAFSGPAMSALAPNLVPRAVLPTAIAISSIAWQAGSIAGPGIGGLLLAVDPVAACLGSLILFAIAQLCFWLIGQVPQPSMARDIHPVRQMIDGLAYVRQNRMLLSTITLDLFAVLLAGSTALLPVYARDILHVGPQGLGMLAAAPAVGATAMAVLFSVHPMTSNVGNRMLGAVIVFGLATIAFGLSTIFLISLAALFVAGCADMVSVYIRQSLIQLHTPDEMRGRVSSVSQLTISASNELGDAESGFVAALIGPVGAVVAGGVGAILITLAWARIFPELRLAKNFDAPDIRSSPQPKEQAA
jgi:MFS family permease